MTTASTAAPAEQAANLYDGAVPVARLADNKIYRHVISVVVDNEAGVLARVTGLFSGRGYNIESLTVSEVDKAKQVSRINVVTSGTHQVIEQIKNQLGRLVPVHVVSDLTDDGPSIERELALLKVIGVGKKRNDALKWADKHGANIVESTPKSFIFQLVGTPGEIDEFIERIRDLGLAEVSRTGVTAIACGPVAIDRKSEGAGGGEITLADNGPGS
ncbi:MAG: acetolactate synthase small subunit [Alphaproteobacteria bacterium]|nr:acetolactate synthase small subunit [Alphaproteobacteria bacterium]